MDKEIDIELMTECEERAEEAYHLEIIEFDQIDSYTNYLYNKAKLCKNNS